MKSLDWRGKVKAGFDIIMILIYLGVGIFITQMDGFLNPYGKYNNIIFGAIIISYALFRIYKLKKDLSEAEDE
ncbi:MAG: hypothetical protein HXY49_07715 [Ignavibacteriaceae bacterium]|jgi:hypothetical protein|nr:hypothetical protein [Ignavibacteriaceae bacterium]